jgi:hypothetical protein
MKLMKQTRKQWLSGGTIPRKYIPATFNTLSRCMLVGTMATAIASLIATPVRADEISELKAEIRAMNKRLSEVEEQRGKVKALNDRLRRPARSKLACPASTLSCSGSMAC